MDFGAKLRSIGAEILLQKGQISDNLMPFEREAYTKISDLVKRKQIVLVKWDKGQGCCIMPHENYMRATEIELLKSYTLTHEKKNESDFEQCQIFGEKH